MNATAAESLRLFYALLPDDVTRTALTGLQTPLRGRKTEYENLHITLAFLGEQPVTVLPVLEEILMRLPQSRMTLVLDRIGYFKQHRIAWAGMHETPDALITLRNVLVEKLRQQNVPLTGLSSFRPHVTLARNAPPPPTFPFEPIFWEAGPIALIQSVTGPQGAAYRVLRISAPLAEPGIS